jgi:ankyrin repeat protein
MDIDETFIASIKAGDLTGVEEKVSENSSLANQRDENGLPAVLLAMYYGHPEIADFLVAAGARLGIFEAASVGDLARTVELLEADPGLVNAYSPDGYQPLGLAAFFGQAQVAVYLVARGAAVNSASKNSMQVMPLHSAVAGQHLEIARLLIDQGADVNARQSDGFTALHGAAQNGQIEMIQLLLAHGADTSARGEGGMTALDYASRAGHPDVEAWLNKR